MTHVPELKGNHGLGTETPGNELGRGRGHSAEHLPIVREAGGSQLQPDPGQEPGTVTKGWELSEPRRGLGSFRSQTVLME